MHRFFVKPEQIHGDQIMIDGEEFKHAAKAVGFRYTEIFYVCVGCVFDYNFFIFCR